MLLIHQARIVNEGRVFKGSVLVNENKIEAIFKNEVPTSVLDKAEIIDAEDCFLLPGLIDDHVHFRDPGLTQKEICFRKAKPQWLEDNVCHGYVKHNSSNDNKYSS